MVVAQPESGDSIQFIKSGLMEIPDVLCLNKNDRPGATTAKRLLQAAATQHSGNPVSFVETNALDNEGIDTLWGAVIKQFDALGEDGLRQRRRSNIAKQLSFITASRLLSSFGAAQGDRTASDLSGRVESRMIDPLSAAELVLSESGLEDRT
jgi:LAO/AO transport system kinase